MSDILSETIADKEVIKSLLNEIARLKGIIVSQTEGKLLLDVDGNVYLSTQHELVSEAGVAEQVEKAKKQIAEFEAVKKTADRLQGSSEQAPEAPSAPAQPVQPAPSTPDVNQPAPATPPAPVAPSTPEAPAAAPAPIIVQ